MGRICTAVLLVALLAAAGCDDETPTGPSPAGVNIAGRWQGNIDVGGTSAAMLWDVTQSGTAVTGPVLVTLATGIVLLNGALSGTLDGATLTYSIAVPAGGIPSQLSCSGQIAGTASVASPSTLNGSYSVTASTCPTGLTSGTFTLRK